MKRFFIITRKEEQNIDMIRQLTAWIEEGGGTVSYTVSPQDEDRGTIVVPEGTECILTVGGDGTLVGASQMTSGSGVPLIGMNRGHLGYLCEFDDDTARVAVDQLLKDEFQIEERMMLSGYVVDENGVACPANKALNDIVLTAGYGLNVLSLTVYVNGKNLYTYLCDGMIFSTPTGSTAYNLSANGPIVNPKTSVILLTPINAHTLNSRSIVLDQWDRIEVEIRKRRRTTKEEADVLFDGGHRRLLSVGGKVVVQRAEETTKIIMLSNMNFLERMSKKLQAD